jgi:hypothetical protein
MLLFFINKFDFLFVADKMDERKMFDISPKPDKNYCLHSILKERKSSYNSLLLNFMQGSNNLYKIF